MTAHRHTFGRRGSAPRGTPTRGPRQPELAEDAAGFAQSQQDPDETEAQLEYLRAELRNDFGQPRDKQPPMREPSSDPLPVSGDSYTIGGALNFEKPLASRASSPPASRPSSHLSSHPSSNPRGKGGAQKRMRGTAKAAPLNPAWDIAAFVVLAGIPYVFAEPFIMGEPLADIGRAMFSGGGLMMFLGFILPVAVVSVLFGAPSRYDEDCHLMKPSTWKKILIATAIWRWLQKDEDADDALPQYHE